MKKLFSFLIVSVVFISPVKVMSQSYEQTRNFCKISQMLAPIFLRGGDISGKSVCEVSGGSYQCKSSMSLGAGVCVAGGGSYQCKSSMSLGAGVCVAGGGSYQCKSSMKYAHGVCIAGGGSYQCNSSMSLGTAICIAGGRSSYECSGIGDQDLGVGICMALGRSKYQCANVSVSDAICGFSGNCEGRDAAAIAISMAQTCGSAVLHYGIE
jgi:hypothetical protein